MLIFSFSSKDHLLSIFILVNSVAVSNLVFFVIVVIEVVFHFKTKYLLINIH